MNGQFVDLQDGTRIEVKINFGTMYYLQKCGASNLIKKIEQKQKNKKKASDMDMMEIAAKIIYATLRSNGKKVTFDEAISLMPVDTESIEILVKTYEEEVEKQRKKQEAQKTMKRFSQT